MEKYMFCPICLSESKIYPSDKDMEIFECIRCGKFSVTGTCLTVMISDLGQDYIRRSILSHNIRKMQREKSPPVLTTDLYESILKQKKLPNPNEQSNNLLVWIGNKAIAPDSEIIETCEVLQSVIGGHKIESIYYIANYLQNIQLIKYDRTDSAKSTPPLKFQLTPSGWEEFERINNASKQSKTIFMAMQYGEPELNNVVDNIFRKAVSDCGLNLLVLTDVPRAGLIDDRLRVEIRKSIMLICDITHRNLGAYWEAGFAEGLSKPVIYTCNEQEFKNGASHFDTNHHLTVMWGGNQNNVAENLKATIRATLPDIAKLND